MGWGAMSGTSAAETVTTDFAVIALLFSLLLPILVRKEEVNKQRKERVTVVTVFLQFGGEVWERKGKSEVQRRVETVTSATALSIASGHPRADRKPAGKLNTD